MSLFNDYFKAVYAALNGDALFTGKVSESLSDVSSFPMIWIEDSGSSDWSDKDYNGIEAVITLHISKSLIDSIFNNANSLAFLCVQSFKHKRTWR